jgi:transcription initiation factor TFIIIB Brf1 subunit/transcription initiation factor TFIIB
MIKKLEIEEEYIDKIEQRPIRILKFAKKYFFLDQGSDTKKYAAAALYITLRWLKAPYLLMDFSDKLGINLFKLAKYYRKLAKFLNRTL